ncbi:MAG: aminotransferase class I/II-fold pyridoxal phosphate-dependent enzyme, partial [Thiotrichaceae bacterium]|nr:aminotransferase class I/II-fold pyridoxal phosphate-dependent enzyme [Thiotrichaceae bacterium]
LSDRKDLPPVNFAKEFCQFHNETNFDKVEGLGFLPVPGTKPILPLIPAACGAKVNQENKVSVATMTNPGYPVPKTWANYIDYDVTELRLSPKNNFQFTLADLNPKMDLLMLNYPHNPSGQTVTIEWWRMICDYCEMHNIRIFNDAAYAKLAFGYHDTLADIATEFPNLSWAESYSSSKLGCNFTGWRVGAIVGSEDFINDIATIKGNIDSGLFAPAAVGVLAAIRYEKEAIKQYCLTFQDRQAWLSEALLKRGMKLAINPQATFFNIWKLPRVAFGQTIISAEHFNLLMIQKGGLVGVHFDPYIRYAVVADILQADFQSAVETAFDEAKVAY